MGLLTWLYHQHSIVSLNISPSMECELSGMINKTVFWNFEIAFMPLDPPEMWCCRDEDLPVIVHVKVRGTSALSMTWERQFSFIGTFLKLVRTSCEYMLYASPFFSYCNLAVHSTLFRFNWSGILHDTEMVLTLFDPMTHTPLGLVSKCSKYCTKSILFSESGLGDHEFEVIHDFVDSHECSAICYSMKLWPQCGMSAFCNTLQKLELNEGDLEYYDEWLVWTKTVTMPLLHAYSAWSPVWPSEDSHSRLD